MDSQSLSKDGVRRGSPNIVDAAAPAAQAVGHEGNDGLSLPVRLFQKSKHSSGGALYQLGNLKDDVVSGSYPASVRPRADGALRCIPPWPGSAWPAHSSDRQDSSVCGTSRRPSLAESPWRRPPYGRSENNRQSVCVPAQRSARILPAAGRKQRPSRWSRPGPRR